MSHATVPKRRAEAKTANEEEVPGNGTLHQQQGLPKLKSSQGLRTKKWTSKN
jgi:hypothetical protein